MKLLVEKTHNGYIPAFDSDYELRKLDKHKVGEKFWIDIKIARNYLFHKKYFAMLKLAFENQEKFQDLTEFRLLAQMKAGYYKEVKTEKGIVYMPSSISYDSLDNTAFEQLYNKVHDVLWKEYFSGIDNEVLQNEILNFM